MASNFDMNVYASYDKFIWQCAILDLLIVDTRENLFSIGSKNKS